jgi:transcriptional regulator GlxA family with amidase domain
MRRAVNENPETVVFLLFPGLTVLDLIGPLEVFASANEYLPRPYRIAVAGETLAPVDTDTPVRLMPDVTLDAVCRPFGVVVPGGGRPALAAMGNRVLTGYLKEAAEHAEFVASVCTGALILGAAGLLEGRRATTHWAYGAILEKLGATYVAERWVADGKFTTAAGVSAGIDMALGLLAKLAGEDVAKRTQLGIEYEPAPPLGGLDWSLVDRRQAGEVRLQRAREELAGDAELLRRLA